MPLTPCEAVWSRLGVLAGLDAGALPPALLPIWRVSKSVVDEDVSGIDFPPVAEARIVLEGIEGRIDCGELLTDTLDRGANIGAVAFRTASAEEARVLDHIVDFPVGHVGSSLEREEGSHFELAKTEADLL